MKAANGQRRDFLLSIRPNYAELIVDGQKTVELRRRFPKSVEQGAVALIYCTSPKKAIIGTADIAAVECLPLSKIWSRYGLDARIERKDFDSYFEGCEAGYAILLRNAKRFEKQVGASKLRKQFGFVAPQSFVYLPDKYYSLLGNDQLQASH